LHRAVRAKFLSIDTEEVDPDLGILKNRTEELFALPQFSSARLRCVISTMVTTAPVIFPFSTIGNDEYSTGIAEPSLCQITSVSMRQPSPLMNARKIGHCSTG